MPALAIPLDAVHQTQIAKLRTATATVVLTVMTIRTVAVILSVQQVSTFLCILHSVTSIMMGVIYVLKGPTTCTELGFTDRCCVDELNIGICEIETNDMSCSCQLSCFQDNNKTCCSDIGCART